MSAHLIGNKSKTNIGKLSTGTAADAAYDEVLVDFFDYTLKQIDNGFGQRPRVQYFNIGANEWRFANAWPPVAAESKTLHLQSAGNAVTPGNGHLKFESPKEGGQRIPTATIP